jgi:hypothetical protein
VLRAAALLGVVVCIGFTLAIPVADAAPARTCKGVGSAGGGATSSIQAAGVSCRQAREVARTWLSADCSTGGQPCAVDGFDCRSHQNSNGAVLTTCRRRHKRIRFSSD